MFLNRFKPYYLSSLAKLARFEMASNSNVQHEDNCQVNQTGRVTRSGLKRKVHSPVCSPTADAGKEISSTATGSRKGKAIKVELVDKIKSEENLIGTEKVTGAKNASVETKKNVKLNSETKGRDELPTKAKNKEKATQKKKVIKTEAISEIEEKEYLVPIKNEKQKSEKAPRSKKKGSSVKKEETEGAIPKPELVVPEINIPLKGDIIPRLDGPSPHNGTIQYNNKVYLGAHISAAGGLENAITNAIKIGGTCFALFLKSQRQWTAKPMEESTVEKFKAACAEHNFSPHLILPHGSYLMNLGSQDPVILGKSRATLLDEVQRCDRLGILHYNIHPGSSCGKGSREESIRNIADSINWVHQETPGSRVSIVLENMCRQGNTIGGDLSELAAIIELVFDRTRVGVCLDTCHALAAGYDLASDAGFDAFIDEFERIVGFKYLVAVHLNDSEGQLGCHRDRHASIGKGHIGRSDGGFRRIINCPRFRDIPLILETPYISDETYIQEILHLKSLAIKDTVCA